MEGCRLSGAFSDEDRHLSKNIGVQDGAEEQNDKDWNDLIVRPWTHLVTTESQHCTVERNQVAIHGVSLGVVIESVDLVAGHVVEVKWRYPGLVDHYDVVPYAADDVHIEEQVEH